MPRHSLKKALKADKPAEFRVYVEGRVVDIIAAFTRKSAKLQAKQRYGLGATIAQA
jgi:hypothetical protein